MRVRRSVARFLQLESEYLRLSNARGHQVLDPDSLPLDEVQQHYKIFVSSMASLDTSDPAATTIAVTLPAVS